MIGQEADTSISIKYFQYPPIEGIPLILDESGENSFFLHFHHPGLSNDLSIRHVMIDGSLHLPQGSYFLPSLLQKGNVPDSIHHFSQIYYRKGDYDFSELGLAIKIESLDSSNYTLQGINRSPSIVHSSSSGDDYMQNYLLSYERYMKGASMSVDVLYHLEDFHLPLVSNAYHRKAESFHCGIGLNMQWDNLSAIFNPAFQFTHASRQNESTSYLTLWNVLNIERKLAERLTISLQHRYKMISTERESSSNEYSTHIISPKLRHDTGSIMVEGGVSIHDDGYVPVGRAVYKWKYMYLAADRKFNNVYEPVNHNKFRENNYNITSLYVGYISSTIKVMLEVFKLDNDNDSYPGAKEETEINLPWLRLSHKVGIYNLISSKEQPLDLFNHLSLILSPNIWGWRTARYQPFIGMESFYLKHSGKIGIYPTEMPIFKNLDSVSHIHTSHLINMEFGVLVNHFKVSYRWIMFNILGDAVINSSETNPIIPIRHLEIVWQFLN